MTQITEAVYRDGVLRPVGQLELRQDERVRVIVQSLEPARGNDRDRAIDELRTSIGRTLFRSRGPYPKREELHEHAG